MNYYIGYRDPFLKRILFHIADKCWGTDFQSAIVYTKSGAQKILDSLQRTVPKYELKIYSIKFKLVK